MFDDEQREKTVLLAVSIDPKEDLQKMVDRIQMEHGSSPAYPLLSDPGHLVIGRYGLLNLEDRRNIPHPTVFVIDQKGVVRWRFTETNYKIRATNEDILAALETL